MGTMVIDVKATNFVILSCFTYPVIKPKARGSSSSSSLVMVLSAFVLVVLLFLNSSLAAAAAACNQDDHDSLFPFFSNVSSASPLDWSSSKDCCQWEGVECGGINGRVIGLALPFRGLSGILSPSLANLTHLSYLNLSHNRLSGPFPAGLFPLSDLQILDLSYNRLYGELPSNDNNNTNMALQIVDLSSNHLNGAIPSNSFLQVAGNLSRFNISNNSFTGQIPANICLVSFRSMTILDFSYNDFSGDIPSGIGECSNLQIFSAGFNNFSGMIPDDIYKAVLLEQLSLPLNRLSGPISDALVNLNKLRILDLYSNQLIGPIPRNIGKLSNLEQLQLHINNLTGSIPPSLTNCNKLMTLNLRVNFLEGELSAFDFSNFTQLSILDLGNNNFTDLISNLTNLEKLDLSDNHLSGEIPASLKGLNFLSSFSVANNNLQGPIPSGGQFDTFPSSSFTGNPGLCGPILQRSCSNPSGPVNPPALHKSTNIKLVVGLVLGVFFGTGLLFATLALWILSKRRIIPGGDSDNMELDTISSNSHSGFPPGTVKDTSLVILFPNNSNEIKNLNISELLKATDNFNQENIVGCGGFGLVYKATLPDGTKVAVKKLSGEMGLMEKEFKAEVEALSTAQHENLVSLQGYCVYEGFRLLIYSYMENGSLDYWLHEKADGASQLDWPTRLKIARGASCGLAYMHQICEPHIIHRDIKSSNILLDEQFKAHVADFGLSRLILPYHTHVTTELVGTLGYIPPEYGQAWVATLRGDVYSFGVVMLELLTGKRPVEVFKPKMSRELVGWVQQMRREGKQDEVFDPLLKGKGFDDEMLQVLDVACMCVNQNPIKRPTIQEVVDWLKNVGSDRNQNKS
uniref:non-specific serine/threonine protein kinase n=1 Tax=Manihot esculenta TaxID=3983 RepID=A0A2C9W460_MANES